MNDEPDILPFAQRQDFEYLGDIALVRDHRRERLEVENAQLRSENQELRAQLVASTAHIRELSAAGRA